MIKINTLHFIQYCTDIEAMLIGQLSTPVYYEPSCRYAPISIEKYNSFDEHGLLVVNMDIDADTLCYLTLRGTVVTIECKQCTISVIHACNELLRNK